MQTERSEGLKDLSACSSGHNNIPMPATDKAINTISGLDGDADGTGVAVVELTGSGVEVVVGTGVGVIGTVVTIAERFSGSVIE